MRLPPAARAGGATLLEMALVLIIIGILGAILLDRLRYYQEAAERVHMEVTAKALQSALRLEMAFDLMAGRRIDYPRLLRENPINWLERKPVNYQGEFDRPDPARLPPGSWHFDRGRREVVYLVNQGRFFRPDRAGLKRVRYSVRQIQAQGAEGVATLRLEAVEPYRWDIP